MTRKRNIAWCSLLVILLTPWVWAASPTPDQLPSPLKAITLKNGDTFVFLGDSITHQCLYTQYFEDYVYTRFPQIRVRFHNSGVGGDRVGDALIRFERDVAHYKPKYVSILLGMNDGRYQKFDEATFEVYREGMLKLLEKIRATGATPILMHPTMFDSRAVLLRNPNATGERLEYYNGVLAYYGAWLREVVYRQGGGYVDMYSWLNLVTFSRRKEDPRFTLIPDAVHPGPAGHVIMAAAMVRDLGLPHEVWRLHIDAAGETPKVITAVRCAVRDLKCEGDRLSFVLHTEALPWVVPPEAQLGAELIHLGPRFSRETLRITGLAPGLYAVSANGESLGRFSAARLAVGVQLQDIPQWPLRRQAAQVAALNKQRNEQAVRPLRNLWSQKKRLRFARAALEQRPDDQRLKTQVQRLEQTLSDFEAQIATLEEKAAGFEARIREAAQPKPVSVVIERVESPND